MLAAAPLDGGEDSGFRRGDVIGPIFQGSGVPTCKKNAWRGLPRAGLAEGPVWRLSGLLGGLPGWQLPWPAPTRRQGGSPDPGAFISPDPARFPDGDVTGLISQNAVRELEHLRRSYG